MRWIRVRGGVCLLAVVAVDLFCPTLAGSDGERILSIYSPARGYSVGVLDRGGHDYAALVEILQPLGSLEARTDKNKVKLRFNNLEAEFTGGKKQARVAGKKFDLPANFLVEDGRGLMPVSSLSTVLPRFLGEPVAFHEAARRLFVGNASTQFTAELDKTQASTLVFNFNAPVNPTIATEPGKLRMVFSREPLVPPGTQSLTFNDKNIPSATFQEDNGAAEIAVTSMVPVIARFSNQGRTITVAPVVQATAAPAPAPISPTLNQPSGAAAGSSATGPASQPSAHPGPRFLVVLDASHGGDERGAALTDRLAEKDIALAMARKLRQELATLGVETLMLRDSDASLTLDQRAGAANQSRAALYLCIHVATQGTGVRLYTSLLPAANQRDGLFVPWNAAQAGARETSQSITRELALELTKKEIPVRTLAAPLRPLNNVLAPAIAIELAPPSTDPAEVASAPYQLLVAQSIAATVAHARPNPREAR
jgi:N-acetylmuramoyl-L-alanine amidase